LLDTDGTGWDNDDACTTGALYSCGAHYLNAYAIDEANHKSYIFWWDHHSGHDDLCLGNWETDDLSTWTHSVVASDISILLEEIVAANNKIYAVYVQGGGGPVFTGEMNTDGTAWSYTQRTSGVSSCWAPDMVFDSSRNDIHYVYTVTGPPQIHTAKLDLDTGQWNSQTRSSGDDACIALDSSAGKIYYAFSNISGGKYQIWTASANVDGTSWSATHQDTFEDVGGRGLDMAVDTTRGRLNYMFYGKENPTDTVYDVFTADMSTDGSGWSTTRRTDSSYDSQSPALALDLANSKIQYVYREKDWPWVIGIYGQRLWICRGHPL